MEHKRVFLQVGRLDH